jgi:hypothetical protein
MVYVARLSRSMVPLLRLSRPVVASMTSTTSLRWVLTVTIVASFVVAPAYAADPEAVAWRIADLLMGPLGIAVVLATGCVAIYRFLFGDHNGTGLLVTWAIGGALFFGLNTIVGYLK